MLRVITLWQPWASLLVAPPLPGGIRPKVHETRGWQTFHHGEFAVHAAKKWDRPLQRAFIELETRFPEVFRHAFGNRPVPLGRIVGTVVVHGCFPTATSEPDSELDREFGDWSEGRYAWRTFTPTPLAEPVPAVGKQGLWTLPPDVESAVRAQLAEDAR